MNEELEKLKKDLKEAEKTRKNKIPL